MAKAPNTLRIKLNAVLALARTDRPFRTLLVRQPKKALTIFGLSARQITNVSKMWGVPGNVMDCGAGTCRLTNPCGWTICGKTTNSCGGLPEWETVRVNPPQQGAARARSGGARRAARKKRPAN